jgi:1-acyl-sn-glycerol-3-phosphate acyltransferase
VGPFPLPEAEFRRLLRRLCGRLRYAAEGLARIPREGPLLLVLNHTGWEEILLLHLCVPRPLRFVAMREVMHLDEWASWQRLFITRHFVHAPLAQRAFFVGLGRLIGPAVRAQMQALGVIPVHIYDEGLAPRFGKNGGDMLTALGGGEAVVIFPEAGLQRGGTMYPFRPGVGLLLQLLQRRGLQVPVVAGAQRSAGAISMALRNRYLPRLCFAPPVVVEWDRAPHFERRATRALQDRVCALLPRVFSEVPRQTYAALDPFPEDTRLPALLEVPPRP